MIAYLLLSNHVCKACQNCLHPSFVIVHKAVRMHLLLLYCESSRKCYHAAQTTPTWTNPIWHGVRLSPFPRVETRFNTHNQNAFANAFLEFLRLSSISQNHDYEYTVRPRIKNIPLKRSCDQVPGCMTVVKYGHYAFEWYIVEIPPVMHHWAALFSKLNVKIHLFHFKEGR